MSLGKKIMILALVTVFFVAGLVACGKGGSDTRLVFTTGFGKDEIFKIGDESCSKAELMVYLVNTQNQYENAYGEEIWNTSLDGVTLEENVKETVLAQIARVKTMYLLALEKGVTLEEEEETRVKQCAQEYFTSLTETEVELLELSYETVEKLYREYVLAEKVYQHIIQDVNPEISDDEARTITVQHILLRTVTTDAAGNVIPDSEEEKKAAYKQISQIRELAVSGAQDFGELASQYSEDSTITYSFGKGEMDEAFEKASFDLGTDEISEVVESEVGYHIIKCINTFNREETDANKLEIVEQRRKEIFGQEYDAFVANLARKLNQKLWNEITLISDGEVKSADFFEVYTKYFPKES